MTINETLELIAELQDETMERFGAASKALDSDNVAVANQEATAGKTIFALTTALRKWNSQRVQSAASEAAGGIKSNVD